MPSGTDHDQMQLSRIESDSLRLPPSRAIRQINDTLSSESSPSGFLPAAENTLLAASDDFTGALGIEAIRIARARHATAVDQQDVQDADKRLRGSASGERQGWMIGMAGFTGGAAIAILVAVVLSPKPISDTGYWWTAIALLGAACLTLFSLSYPGPWRKA